MQIEVNKNELAGALVALGKLICRTSPMDIFKAVQIEGRENDITFTTCSQNESIEFRMDAVVNEPFRTCVQFEPFRVAVRGCKNKTLMLEYIDKVLKVDGAIIEGVNYDGPFSEPMPSQFQHLLLPDNFVELLSLAAPVVSRNDYRKILQGINLSRDGITATNGKELFNVESVLEVNSLTIPFPIALMATKASGHAGLFFWQNETDTKFKVCYQNWTWTAKALQGTYPNWKQIVPEEKALQHTVEFSSDQAQHLMTFLKQVPDDPPNNCIDVSMADQGSLKLHSTKWNMQIIVAAEFKDDWGTSTLNVNCDLLMRLLSEGHTRLQFSDQHGPFMASGGRGMYIAMPLYKPEGPKVTEETSVQPNQEEVKMNETITNVGSAYTQTVEANTNNNQPESIPMEPVNPMDELTACIEALKLKIKAMFDESSALSRKVKEVQLAQRQKERDFILAKKAIERIRLASSF